jgi:hypothetical protein
MKNRINYKQKSLALAIAASVGVAATGAVSAFCANKGRKDDTVKSRVFQYVPAVIVGGCTIGCITASTYISREEVACITATAAAAIKKLSDYKKSVADVASEAEQEAINSAFYSKQIDIVEDVSEDPTFVDSFAGYTFRRNLEDVKKGIGDANNLYKEQGFIPWCDVIFLANDGDQTPYWSIAGRGFDYGFGWSEEMLVELYSDEKNDPILPFEISLTPLPDRDNTYVIDYTYPPEMCFMEF